jgi:hypothetical protein
VDASAANQPYPGYPHEIFDILAGDVRVESGELQRIGARTARAFVAPWRRAPTGRPLGLKS